jgi:transposase
MEIQPPVGSRMLRYLRTRERQQFYNGVANLAKIAWKRPYTTPVLFLVIKNYADRFGIVDYFNGIIEWDEKQWKISPGILALSLIYVSFMVEDGRIPLYKIPEHFRSLDLFLLFGQPLRAEDFNDDLYGNLLDRLGKIGCLDVLRGITDQVYQIFNMPQSSDLNSDTTSHVMYGKYSECDEKDFTGLVITPGHSKAHRPDLKQIKTGLIVDGNGVVRLVEVLDGNESDSTWNLMTIEALRIQLGDKTGTHILIADSKFVNIINLREVNKSGEPLKFISLIPANFYYKISTTVRAQAYETGGWVALGTCCQNTKAKDRATYAVQSFENVIEGVPYRLLVIKTTSVDIRIQHKLDTEQADVNGMAVDTFSEPFACRADAEDATIKFQKKTKKVCFKAILQIVPIDEEKKYPGRKPKIPRVPEVITRYKVEVLGVDPDVPRIEQFKRSEESFVLITNVPQTELSDRDVLRKYKRQFVVERSFSSLKRPMMVHTLFLKKPVRVKGLLSLVYVALLFQSIMQAIARHRAKLVGELPKIRYAKRKLDEPTYDLLTYLLAPFEVWSLEYSRAVSCLVPEMEKHLNRLLYLVDAEAC